jgi:ribose transport system substrate-binding protein
VTGYGNTEPARAAIKRGEMLATVEQNPGMAGAMAVECAVRAVQGDTSGQRVTVPVELITADQIGSTPSPTAAKILPKGG